MLLFYLVSVAVSVSLCLFLFVSRKHACVCIICMFYLGVRAHKYVCVCAWASSSLRGCMRRRAWALECEHVGVGRESLLECFDDLWLFMHIKCPSPSNPPTSCFDMGRRPRSVNHFFFSLSLSLSLSHVFFFFFFFSSFCFCPSPVLFSFSFLYKISIDGSVFFYNISYMNWSDVLLPYLLAVCS